MLWLERYWEIFASAQENTHKSPRLSDMSQQSLLDTSIQGIWDQIPVRENSSWSMDFLELIGMNQNEEKWLGKKNF